MLGQGVSFNKDLFQTANDGAVIIVGFRCKVILFTGKHLLLRFFAYSNCYLEFDHAVKDFLDEFLIKNQDTFDEAAYTSEFTAVLTFVENNFPFGFAKTKTSKITPRVRFEALSVGVALALRQNPTLTVSNVDWMKSDEFRRLTTSDASNNQGKLKERVEYVRDQLLKDALPNE